MSEKATILQLPLEKASEPTLVEAERLARALKLELEERKQLEGNAVLLRVHNQGPPIPEDLLSVLFDPFRGRSAQSEARGDGLGLGLYICREMIRAHRGEVTVQSREGAGTTFTVRPPRQCS